VQLEPLLVRLHRHLPDRLRHQFHLHRLHRRERDGGPRHELHGRRRLLQRQLREWHLHPQHGYQQQQQLQQQLQQWGKQQRR
jgi:hypothetical protein